MSTGPTYLIDPGGRISVLSRGPLGSYSTRVPELYLGCFFRARLRAGPISFIRVLEFPCCLAPESSTRVLELGLSPVPLGKDRVTLPAPRR